MPFILVMDIWLKIYHYDWISDVDIFGPVTTMVSATPNPAGHGWTIDIVANIDDITTGSSDITAAEWCVGETPAGPWNPMTALDGAFDNSTEAVIGTGDTTGWPFGEYKIWVRGQDSLGNWGEAEFTIIEKDKSKAQKEENVYSVVSEVEMLVKTMQGLSLLCFNY